MKNQLITAAWLLSLMSTSGIFLAAFGAPTVTAPPSTTYESWKDTQRQRELPIKIYLPSTGTAPYPTVIFSHGLGGSVEAAPYLGNYWSKHGFLCVFVQHPGSDTSVWKSSMMEGRQAILAKMKTAANGKNLMDRGRDIRFVLDELQRRNTSDPQLAGKINFSKIAIAGHSFGAATSLAIAGQSYPAMGAGLKDDRVKSAIYLCPPVIAGKADPGKCYGSITIPGLLLTGTEDVSPIRDTKAEDRRIPYDGNQAPHQYLVNFVGADHGVFGGRMGRSPNSGDAKIQQMVDEVTTHFLDATLNNDQAAWRWLDSNQVKDYLGNAAMLERK